MRIFKIMMLAIGLATLSLPMAYADSIVSNGTATFDVGTGFGNVLSFMAVQNKGSEWGSVRWGCDSPGEDCKDIIAGDAKKGAQTSTRSIGEITTIGGSEDGFTVIFNVNQDGPDDVVTMDTFTLLFFDSGGGLIDDLTWLYSTSEPNQFTLDGQGQGSSGYVFLVTLTDPGLAWVFDDPTNRIGIEVPLANPITGSNDGPDGFYLGPGPGSIIPPVSAPEPGTLVLVGTALMALGCSRLRRRKR